MTIGTSLGGFILQTSPIFHSGEIMNYSLCFIVSIGLKIIALIWTIIMIDERIAQKQQQRIEMKLGKSQEQNSGNKESQLQNQINFNELKQDSNIKDVHPIKMLCDLSNIKEMFLCFIKPRPNKVRAQIWILLLCKTISVTLISGQQFTFQFVQKIYFWDSVWFSYVSSCSTIISLIASLTVIPFIINVIKVKDISLALIGFVTKFISQLLIGTFLVEMAYYISIPVDCLSRIQGLLLKSH